MLVRFKFVSLLSVFLLVAFVDSLSEDDINSSISSFSSASAVSGSSFEDESKNVISSLRWNNNDEIGAGFGEPQLAEQNEKVSRPLTNNAVDVNDDRDSDSSSDSDEDDDDDEEGKKGDDSDLCQKRKKTSDFRQSKEIPRADSDLLYIASHVVLSQLQKSFQAVLGTQGTKRFLKSEKGKREIEEI